MQLPMEMIASMLKHSEFARTCCLVVRPLSEIRPRGKVGCFYGTVLDGLIRLYMDVWGQSAWRIRRLQTAIR